MRKTLHEYIIAKEAECATPAGINVKKFYQYVLKYAKLTNRQPKLGDFVPTDDEGNVLEVVPYAHEQSGMSNCSNEYRNKYQQDLDSVIFKGNWEVFHDNEWSCLIKKDEIILNWIKEKNYLSDNLGNKINSIEDLPLEIEFKEGVI